MTTLRNVIGSLSLEDVLTSRDKINADLRIVLDEATERWGLRVNRIELKSIDPPGVDPGGDGEADAGRARAARRDHQRRGRQAGADHDGRGREAGGDPHRRRLAAGDDPHGRGREGGPRSSRAQGEAEATRQVFSAIHDGDPSPDLLTYQYIQNLPRIADGQSTKLMIIPSDAVATMGAVAALGGGFQTGRETAAARARSRPRGHVAWRSSSGSSSRSSSPASSC